MKVESIPSKAENKTPPVVEASGAAGPSKKTDTMPKEPPKKKAKAKKVKDTCVETCTAGPKSGCTIRGKGKPAGNLSCAEVDRRIEALGMNPNRASLCVKSAIQKGFIKITGEDKEELNQVVLSGVQEYNGGCWFGHTVNATLGDLLRQRDYAGLDYEEGCMNATVVCKECEDDPENTDEVQRTYVTEICTGEPKFDDGKYHNHCWACPGFGMCIGDYRLVVFPYSIVGIFNAKEFSRV